MCTTGLARRDVKRQRLELLPSHAAATPLAPHSLVVTPGGRREGLVTARTSCGRWTADDTAKALTGCAFDEYLGLRFYREDPLPRIRRYARGAAPGGEKRLFIDHEFPVHDDAVHYLQVDTHAPNKKEIVRCTPGIVASSNCRDFRTDPNRVRRIDHYIRMAEYTRGRSRWIWVRGSAVKNCSLFSSEQSADVRNVLQGKVGNCGFVSGFSSVAASWPEALVNAFGEGSNLALSECGAVSVLLYPRGQPRYLLLDDYILCNNCNNTGEGDGESGRKTKSPSMHSLLDNDLWVRLLEKAFVKVQGSYASLDGYYKYNSLYRHPARALQLLTGAPLAMEIHYGRSDAEVVYDILGRATQGKYARVAHCRKRMDGLVPNHGYSLLWVGEGAGGVKLACLRNPHGEGSYTGRYGFGRPAEELQLALFGERAKAIDETLKCFAVCKTTGRIIWQPREGRCHPAFALQNSNHDNGIFFMEFKTFVECFPKATIVGPIQLRTDVDRKDGTKKDAPLEEDTNVPDCVHIVKREKLVRVRELIGKASREE
ncbi:hypothetical protein ACHAXT_012728 [Thalassiosira profunda]